MVVNDLLKCRVVIFFFFKYNSIFFNDKVILKIRNYVYNFNINNNIFVYIDCG